MSWVLSWPGSHLPPTLLEMGPLSSGPRASAATLTSWWSDVVCACVWFYSQVRCSFRSTLGESSTSWVVSTSWVNSDQLSSSWACTLWEGKGQWFPSRHQHVSVAHVSLTVFYLPARSVQAAEGVFCFVPSAPSHAEWKSNCLGLWPNRKLDSSRP